MRGADYAFADSSPTVVLRVATKTVLSCCLCLASLDRVSRTQTDKVSSSVQLLIEPDLPALLHSPGLHSHPQRLELRDVDLAAAVVVALRPDLRDPLQLDPQPPHRHEELTLVQLAGPVPVIVLENHLDVLD